MGHTIHTCASTVSLDSAFLHTFVLLLVVYLPLCVSVVRLLLGGLGLVVAHPLDCVSME